MMCTITENFTRGKNKIDVNFYGSKDDLIQCIFALIRVYFEK